MKLSNQNAYKIKDIARQLPEMEYQAFVNKRTNETFRKVFNFLAHLWITAWWCRWYFNRNYIVQHKVNHERRIRRAFQKYGLIGIRHYLEQMGMDDQLIRDNLSEFEVDAKEQVQLYNKWYSDDIINPVIVT